MEPRIEIVNIVVTLKLDPMPDPSDVLKRIPGTRPLRRFRGALLRIGRIPVLFYKSKIVITGSKSMGELDNTIGKLVSILREHQFSTRLVSSEIVNITAKAFLRKQLNLWQTAEKLNGIYDPDYRPYAIAKVNGLTLLISQYGRIVFLGAKSLDQIYNAWSELLRILA